MVWDYEVYMDISRGYGSFSKGLKQNRKALIFQKGSTVIHTCLRFLNVSKKKSQMVKTKQRCFALSFLGSARNYMKHKFTKSVHNYMFLNTMCPLK